MDEIPKEVYYFIGLLVVTKFDTIVGFFKSRVQAEVKLALQESAVQNLTIMIGELKQKITDLEKDLNQAFIKMREK